MLFLFLFFWSSDWIWVKNWWKKDLRQNNPCQISPFPSPKFMVCFLPFFNGKDQKFLGFGDEKKYKIAWGFLFAFFSTPPCPIPRNIYLEMGKIPDCKKTPTKTNNNKKTQQQKNPTTKQQNHLKKQTNPKPKNPKTTTKHPNPKRLFKLHILISFYLLISKDVYTNDI